MDKRRSLRSRFENNYVAVSVPADNKRGVKVKYVYYAPWYIWDLPAKKLRKKKIYIFLVSIISFALFCISVSMPCPINSKKPVFLASTLALCCHIMEAAALVQFMPAKSRTTKLKYEQISRGLDFFPALRAACMAAATIFCVVYVILGGFSIWDIITTILYFVGAALAWSEHICYKKIPFFTEENDALKKIRQAELEAEQKDGN